MLRRRGHREWEARGIRRMFIEKLACLEPFLRVSSGEYFLSGMARLEWSCTSMMIP